MTARELINKLSEYNLDFKVVVNGYEDGYDEVKTLHIVNMEPNPDKSKKYWEGEYNYSVDSNSESAILLPRS